MKQNWVFVGLGVIVATILTFILRLVNGSFFQSNMSISILMGGLGVVLLIFGMIGKSKKPLMFFGAGVIATAVVMFLLRSIGLSDNVTLLIVVEIVGLAILIYGLMKGKR